MSNLTRKSAQLLLRGNGSYCTVWNSPAACWQWLFQTWNFFPFVVWFWFDSKMTVKWVCVCKSGMLGLKAWPRPRSRGQILAASASGCLASVSNIWPRPRVERGQGRGLWVWACEVRGCFTIVLIYILLNSGCEDGINIYCARGGEFKVCGLKVQKSFYRHFLFTSSAICCRMYHLQFSNNTLALSAKAFSVNAPAVWNSLSLNCRSANTLSTFKLRLKSELFTSAYGPTQPV